MIPFTIQLFKHCDIDCMLIKQTHIAKNAKKHKSTETQQKTKKNIKKLRNITKKIKGFEKRQGRHSVGYIYQISNILVHVAPILVALTHK